MTNPIIFNYDRICFLFLKQQQIHAYEFREDSEKILCLLPIAPIANLQYQKYMIYIFYGKRYNVYIQKFYR